MRHAFTSLITMAFLAGCSISPVSLNDVPSKSDFSERQLIEDQVIRSGKVEELRLSSGYYPNLKRAVIDSNLDNTWNAVLSDIAGAEEIRDRYFNYKNGQESSSEADRGFQVYACRRVKEYPDSHTYPAS